MDDHTFDINFGCDGTVRLREKVNEKLKELMGDYTDDTLVEYVLVLLRNGRSKDEATRELNVFLGDDDSISFVSWLWDHLSSNLNLYAQAEESMLKPRGDRSTQEQAHRNIGSDSENEREELSKAFTSRKHIERKGSVQENGNFFPLRNTVRKKIQSMDRDNTRLNRRRPLSPKPCNVMKRSLEDDRPMKRDGYGAPRRLLQFAVRDAMKTMNPAILKSVQLTNAKPVPALKKLRSVVSTSTTDTVLTEEPQRLRSVAVKASVEAAEDTTKKIYPRSVFNIGSGSDFNKESAYDGDTAMLDTNTDVIPEDLTSDNDQDINDGVSASSANKPNDSLTLQYSVAQDANEVARGTQFIDQELSYNGKEKPSSKIVNISVNVNTWKPPTYAVPRAVQKVENQEFVNNSNNVPTAGKTNAQLSKVNNFVMTAERRMVQNNVQVEQHETLPSTPSSYTTSNPSDDSESRTLFVSNVHFAATKDTLSQHFNKFGKVLKVIILNEAATCKPKGAAYVEFFGKESAESALSLNGTYFMSRSLKVVRKTESTEMSALTNVSRAQPFTSSASRIAFPRKYTRGAIRGRIPIKLGARSLQWKRGDSSTQTANNVLSPMGRNLTYVRPELKVDSSMGPA